MPKRFVISLRIAVTLLCSILPAVAFAQARVVKVVSSDGQPIVYANVAIDGGETRISDEKSEVSFGVGKRRGFTVAMTVASLRGQNPPVQPPAKAAAPKRSVWTPLDTMSVIHGVATDSAGRALEGIEIYVVTSGRSAQSDAAGRYRITGIIEGPTRLRARRLGWRPVDTAVVVAPHSSVAVNFKLGSRISALDTIRVTASQDDCPPRELAGFQCRRRAGVGVFRDSAELAALEPEYVADLFDGIPGLRREGHNVKAVTRWRCINYLFNGHPPTALDRMTARMLSFAQDVVAIEFFEDHQTAPERYKIYAGRCSLIVFWMKGAK